MSCQIWAELLQGAPDTVVAVEAPDTMMAVSAGRRPGRKAAGTSEVTRCGKKKERLIESEGGRGFMPSAF